MATITVEWLYGRPQNGAEEDELRAAAAAEAVLDEAGVKYKVAERAYCQQYKLFGDEGPMHGPARAWIKATRAADQALTAGWDKPGTAACTISAS